MTAIDTVLIVEDDIIVRTPLAEYLRNCGYRVIEATSADEAMVVLNSADVAVEILFSAIEIPGRVDGFGLAQWVRGNRPDIDIILCGNTEKAANAAGDLCEQGPHLKKPYEPQAVVDWIKRLKKK